MNTEKSLKKIKSGYILPSAAIGLKSSQLKWYTDEEHTPQLGDVVYGKIVHIGQHSNLENKSGRIHAIHNDSKAIFVFSHRYAPDYYEGFVPKEYSKTVDLLARSGMVGRVNTKNNLIKDPSQVEILGYVCDANGKILNTKDFPLVTPKQNTKKYPRAKMILVCGTTMNSGKSAAAAAICWGLSTLGHNVKGSKVTGTASLKDILHMNDAGASSFSDFTYVGYPATYMLEKSEIIDVFNKLDLKYANNPQNYWVVELADGINQRETAMLLESKEVQERMHKLIFCANDAFSAMGGLEYMKDRFELKPDMLSGVCTSSPLHIRELSEVIDIPIFDSMNVNLNQIKTLF